MTSVGIDLAASIHSDSGVAALQNGKVVEAKVVKTEKEILDFVQKYKPQVVAVDVPLSWPLEGNYRQAEKILQIMGLRIFPLKGIESRELGIKRAMRLSKSLTDTAVIETFPIPLRGHFTITTKNPHIRDAIICANVANLHQQGKTIAYGDKKEGHIIMPIR